MKRQKKNLPINRYAILSILANMTNKAREKTKDELLPECNQFKPLANNKWSLAYTVTPMKSLNVEQIRRDMSAEWIKKYEVPGTRREIKATSFTGEQAKIKAVELTDELLDEIYQLILAKAEATLEKAD